MATIGFYVNEAGVDTAFPNEVGASGIGFFGSGGYPYSVPVGEYQNTTYLTDGSGSVSGIELPNVKYVHLNSGEINTVATNLRAIANAEATLNIRFSHSSSVDIQNATLYIYDRVAQESGAVGVTTKVAEICKTGVSSGIGDTGFFSPTGTDNNLALSNSPGSGGTHNDFGSGAEDLQHDWFVVLSASPNSVGSKQSFGLLFSCEYL